MPDYAKNYKRDVYGELGWHSNFEVKSSKNNEYRFASKKEFFDKPTNYQSSFSKSPMTKQEFYRHVAPKNSIAHTKSKSCADL